ncbi:MAG: N-6 DNA methylase [Coriobacteriia bacterium]
MGFDIEEVEGVNPQAASKARGAFFTPPEMAEFIAHWALRAPEDRVLEPSCGEAAFLVPAIDQLSALGQSDLGISHQVWGAELHAPSAKIACKMIRSSTGIDISDRVRVGDFFEARVERDLPWMDACIGNPPYIRYQSFAGDARRRGREAALAAGVRIDGLASSWAPFTVHAASFLRPGGRLGLVLPAELLSVNYAAPVRRYLLDHFGCVRVILFEERVFPDVLEEVVLLLAEGEGPCDRFDIVQVTGLSDLATLEKREWSTSPDAGKWTKLLLPEPTREAVVAIDAVGGFTPLGDAGTISIGMVTGGNDYFCISEAERLAHNLSPAQVRRMLPPGSKHARGIDYTSAHWEEARDEGARVWLFSPSTYPSNAARAYIRQGEELELDQAYKCRVRTPWFRVPAVNAPDLFMVYMANEGPRFIENPSRLLNVNSVHGLYLNAAYRDLASVLPTASLTTFTLLGAELVGRSYGGGLLKLEPREALNLPVPSAALLKRCKRKLMNAKPTVDAHLRHGRFNEAVQVVDYIILVQGMSLGPDVVDGVRQGREHLFGRRKKRSQG